MLRAEGINKSYIDRVLFTNLSFDIGDRDRIALIDRMVPVKPRCSIFSAARHCLIPARSLNEKTGPSAIYIRTSIQPPQRNCSMR